MRQPWVVAALFAMLRQAGRVRVTSREVAVQ